MPALQFANHLPMQPSLLCCLQLDLVATLAERKQRPTTVRPGARLTEVSDIIDDLIGAPDTTSLATSKQVVILMQTKVYDTREEAEAVPRKDASEVIKAFFDQTRKRRKIGS